MTPELLVDFKHTGKNKIPNSSFKMHVILRILLYLKIRLVVVAMLFNVHFEYILTKKLGYISIDLLKHFLKTTLQ